MFEKLVRLATRGSFLLERDDNGDECISLLVRNLGKRISSETMNRLRSIN